MSKGSASDNNAAHITSNALPQSDGVDSKKSGSGRMIMKEGNSVYLDKLVVVLSFALRRKKKHEADDDRSPLWTSVSHEVCDALAVD